MAEGNVDDDLICHVCFSVFVSPITNTCGHTTCQHCLRGCNGRCPDCREPLPPRVGVNIVLQNLIASRFPVASAARRAEVEAQAAALPQVEEPVLVEEIGNQVARELRLENGRALTMMAIPAGTLVGDVEELAYETILEMDMTTIGEIQILESSQIRLLSDGHSLSHLDVVPGPNSRLTVRIIKDNQLRINSLPEHFEEDAIPDEVRIVKSIAASLETVAADPFKSRNLSRLLDAVEEYVERIPPPPPIRGSYNLTALQSLAELLEKKLEDLQKLPQLIMDLAAEQGF